MYASRHSTYPNDVGTLSVMPRSTLSILCERFTTRVFLLNAFERAFVTVVFGYFAYRMTHTFMRTQSIIPLLIIVSESLPILLIYSRPSSKTLSDKPSDWVFALTGTSAPLFADSSVAMSSSIYLQSAVLAFVVVGLCVQISAKIILWRSFGILPANRGVKVHGPYRFVRHPMYAGYEITHIGVLLAFPSIYNFLLYSIALAIQIARLFREERVLNQDPAYRDFAARVRFRLLPGIF